MLGPVSSNAMYSLNLHKSRTTAIWSRSVHISRNVNLACQTRKIRAGICYRKVDAVDSLSVKVVGPFDWTFAFDGTRVSSVVVIGNDPVELRALGLNTSEFNGCYGEGTRTGRDNKCVGHDGQAGKKEKNRMV